MSDKSGDFSQHDRAEVQNKFKKVLESGLSTAVSTRFDDFIAATSWLAGEFALRQSGFLSRILPDTLPGTILLSDDVDYLVLSNPLVNYVNDLYEAIAYIDPSVDRDNWRLFRQSNEEYDRDYAGPWLTNHPAAVANRIRNKIIELAKGFPLENGKIGILTEGAVALSLIRNAGYSIGLYNKRKGDTREHAGLAMHWLVMGSRTMPGPGAETPPRSDKPTATIMVGQPGAW
ncbi:MAG: hypothetical protein K2Y22_02320 [Candidatus Obscuribacterales bacterium]|nr:hypothetical protein [Candidatus Obscuribacterales bacterium]